MKIIDAARRAPGFDPVQEHPRWERTRWAALRAWPFYASRYVRWRISQRVYWPLRARLTR